MSGQPPSVTDGGGQGA